MTVKTEHSTLLADTGLSEIELDRMGFVPVQRRVNPGANVFSNKDSTQMIGTWSSFVDRRWDDDEDVLRNLDLIDVRLFNIRKSYR